MGMFLAKNQRYKEQEARKKAYADKVEPDGLEDKPFKCPYCEMAYREQGYLDAHMTKKHSNI